MTTCFGQTEAVEPDISAIGEGKIIRKATFDGNSLWGYINGGADIYLEYGFNSLLVHEIEYKGKNIRFDLYRMNDPVAAYGIFSVSRFGCDSVSGPGTRNCGTRWQLQSVKSSYYLSVILQEGTAEEYNYALRVAGSMLGKIEPVAFEPGYPFRIGVFDSINAEIKFSKGMLGIDNGMADHSEILRGTGFRTIWNITGIEGYEQTEVSVVTFSDKAGADEFIRRLGEDDGKGYKPVPYRFDDDVTLFIVGGAVSGNNPVPLADWFTGLKHN
jgi:hypothetical protein